MENLDIGNFVFGALVVQAFNLIIILLAKTETILQAIERVKAIVGLDYKNRAKRSDDEVRITRRHAQVAKERVRHSFITMEKWNCKWAWNWSENFEPINIKGFCTGDFGTDNKGELVSVRCQYPVGYYYYERSTEDEDKEDSPPNFLMLGITCANDRDAPHHRTRAEFVVFRESSSNYAADEFDKIISKVILSERDLRIAKEIKILRWLFWR